ncbi:EF-hand domain-containing protein [Sphingomonas sp. OTU376]|uniref:EF-hand domain-containing protein n=1 Tax=Sphingomonas sp. OTU376 TaxID=3043863 RepID=UPI00313F33F8
MLDERMQAAISRLTENEKECLRRRLLPQTAKEMAIELGVSPHAVEKRLKMARTKLGLSSSLQAARLLVQAESQSGSQALVPHAPDLAAPSRPLHAGPVSGGRRRWWIGGIAMSITIAAAALALTLPGAPAPQQSAQAPQQKMKMYDGPFVPATPEQATAYLAQSFATMDKDKSGYLEANEAPRASVSVNNGPRKDVGAEQGGRMFLARFDTNGDGKVSKDEYIATRRPMVLAMGIPANWKPRN